MKKVFLVVPTVLLCFLLCSCSGADPQDVIITFDSFENKEGVILASKDMIYVNGAWSDPLEYLGDPATVLMLEENGAYAFVQDADSYEVSLLFFDYADLSAEVITSIELPDSVISSGYTGTELFFRTQDPNASSQIYTLLSLETYETRRIADDDSEFQTVLSAEGDPCDCCAGRYSAVRNDENVAGLIVRGGRLKITDTETEEEKVVDSRLVKSCEEGKALLKLEGGLRRLLGFSEAYENDSGLFLLNCIEVYTLGKESCYYIVFKYDFESDTVEYYSSVFMEKYKSIDHMRIVG